MVPCQPRQLVIFSLPFAALVAFFWFKRRRSLSRSDPGGTLDRTKLVDNQAEEEDNCRFKSSEVTSGQSPVDEGVRTSRSKEVVTPAPVLFEGDNVTTSEFQCTELFHSTVIEEDHSEIKVDPEDRPTEVTSVEEIVSSSEISYLYIGKSPKRDSLQINNLSEIVVPEEDLSDETEELDITLTENTCEDREEPQSEFKRNNLKHADSEGVLEESSEESLTPVNTPTNLDIKSASDYGSGSEGVENLSCDTGLGSQELSTTEEDSQTNMTLGHDISDKMDCDATVLNVKIASLKLVNQKLSQKRVERDSAVHSPAEVMLNSPAISTFSDAHSEGSSDSGKGCSDVVTPPPHTPAGGSSVAGDQVPSVYEFVLPQVIVGRLIGRHGVGLHDIRNKTHTNVFIKRHPETSSLKICAIEGTQSDIDVALKMIRQKFPIRRFPELTLERVSFVKNMSSPINPENLRLSLVEGVNNDVVVSYVVTASHLCLQLPMHITYQNLYRMACIMNSAYSTVDSPPLLDPQPDIVCVAPAAGGWYRALLLSVDHDTNTSDVKFLDYGGFLTVDNSQLRQIRGDFLLLPFQSIECGLANIVPAGGEEEWSEAAYQFVQTITTQQILQAQVYDYTENGMPLVYLYFTQFYQSSTDPTGFESRVVLLNQELVSLGFADEVEDVTLDEGQTAASETS